MEWKDSYTLGYPPMDNTHRDFVALISKLAAAESDASACLDQLIDHSREHFAQENRWMEECGFPPIYCHTGEHERVLKSLEDMRPTLRTDPGVGRILSKELESWFAQHAATMDDALAYYMRQVNYKPTPGANSDTP